MTSLPTPIGQGRLLPDLTAVSVWVEAQAARQPMLWGSGMMLLATSLWALAFAAPLSVPDASPVEIALGRFIVYGLISLASLGVLRVFALPGGVLRLAVVYALAGNVLYYLLLVLGILWAGASLAVLVIGMLPVTVAVAGGLMAGHARLRLLALPLILFAGGLLLSNLAAIDGEAGDALGLGVVCLIACVAVWTWYAVDNAAFLRRTRSVTAAEWSSVVGIMSLGIALPGLGIAWATGHARNPLELPLAELGDIALWSLLLGGGATWLGTILFNRAAQLLDTGLLGQLIVFEAVFGLSYVFLFSGRIPAPVELVGISVALFAVWLSMRRLMR